MKKQPIQMNYYKDIINLEITTMEEFELYLKVYEYWKYNSSLGIVKNFNNMRKQEHNYKLNKEKRKLIQNIINLFTIIESIDFERYKKAILQESEKAIKYFKETNQRDKYINFKIGDEFTSNRGKGIFSKLEQEGIVSEHYDYNKGHIYPFYTSKASDNHIRGYSKIYNVDENHIKISADGEGTAGLSKFSKSKGHLGGGSFSLVSDKFSNEYVEMILKPKFWGERQGTAVKHVYFRDISQLIIEIPLNHKKLSKKIEEINKWQIQVNETTKKMGKYIQGVLND